MLYSKSIGGFYDPEIHGENIPSDATDESQWAYTHAELLAGQSTGKIITSDTDGFPILSDPVPIPFADQAATYLATVRQTREMILNRLAGISGRSYRAGEIEMAEAADAASVALLDITKAPTVLAATSMDELHDAVLAYYKSLVSSVPEGLRSAFNVVDA